MKIRNCNPIKSEITNHNRIEDTNWKWMVKIGFINEITFWKSKRKLKNKIYKLKGEYEWEMN